MIAEKNVSEWLASEICSYLYLNGLIYNNSETPGVSHIPVSVFPTSVSNFNLILIFNT